MHTTQPLLAVLAGAFIALSSPIPLPSLDAQTACSGGPSTGLWSLPTTFLGTGTARGRLVDSATHLTAYRFTAQLQDVATPCLSCIQGEVQGSLDDGSGGSPEFLVRGRYLGALFAGSGRFDLRVFRPTGGPAIGFLEGNFDDPPGTRGPGEFSATWRICP